MLTTSSLFCKSPLLMSIHAWIHFLSLSICFSFVLLMILSSRTVCRLHHFFSIQLMFFTSAFSPSIHVVIFIAYSLTIFIEKQQPFFVTTSLFYSFPHHLLLFEFPMPMSGILELSRDMIPMPQNNDSVSVIES
jgi:hypothetical protein